MPPTRSLSIAPDLDALEVALVRSIENIRKTLPQNRRQSQDPTTISFAQGQGVNPASNTPLDDIEENSRLVTGEENRRNARDSRYDGDPLAVAESSTSAGPSWKKYIRESEALALELQMESVRQDMRDLAGARERRYQELAGHGDPTRRKLRRVSEVLPQNRASHFVSRSNSEGSRGAGSICHLNDPTAGRKAVISNGEGPEIDSIGSSSMITYNNPFKSSSSSSKPPHARNPGRIGLYILPTTSETCGLSPRHDRSRPTANSRPFSVPAPVLSNLGIAKPTKADSDQKSHHKGASSANSGGSPQNRHSSEGSRAGRKPLKFGEKKVRFAERPVGIEKGPPAEIYGRKPTLNNSSSSSLSSQPLSVSTSNSSDGNTSESESRSFSSTDDGTSGSELYSFSSSDDEEPRPTTVFKPLRTPLGPLDQTGRRIPPQKSPGPTPLQKGPTVTREVNQKDQNKSGGLTRHLSTNSKAKKTTLKEIRPLEDLGEKIERSGKSSGSNIDRHKTFTSDRSLPQHTNPHQFNLSRSNSIRGLLRKHSGNLLNKFSWRGNKASGLSKPPIETRGLACIRCRELFDANLLIQVPAKCLHLYCKSCLKGTSFVPRCHTHSPIASSPIFSDVHSGLKGPSQRMSSSVL